MVYTFGPQMRVFVFFVCLGFLLLMRDECVYAGVPNHSSRSQALSIERSQSVAFQDTDSDHSAIRHNGSKKENKSFICIDVENEENVLTGKYKLPVRCHLTQTLTFIPGQTWGNSNDRLPFCCHLSYKYLIQKALRI
jgi:hypothetical protein